MSTLEKEIFKYAERKRFKEIFHFDAPIDRSLAAFGFKVDIFQLEKMIPGYDPDTCIYKGRMDYSISMAIEEEYGNEARELVESLI